MRFKRPVFLGLSLIALTAFLFWVFFKGPVDSSLENAERREVSSGPPPSDTLSQLSKKNPPKTNSNKEVRLEKRPFTGNITRPLTNEFPNAGDLVKTLLKNVSSESAPVSFKQRDTDFFSLPGIKALPKEELKQEDRENKLGEFLGLSIFKEAEDPSGSGYPLVIDRKTGRLALVTGNLKVKYSGELDSKEIERRFGLKFLQDFAAIKLVFFRAEDTSVAGLVSLSEALREWQGVTRVDLDLLDTKLAPQ